MRIWFWGWLVTAIAIGAVSAVLRDRASFPFAVGAAVATALEAVGTDPGLEWAAFAGVSVVLFAFMNNRWHRPRHLRRSIGRHGANSPHAD